MNDYLYRFYEKHYPDAGETVIIKITNTTEVGVYVELVEYNNIEGLIMVGELSKKKIKCIASTVKTGNIEAAIVLRVDKEKGYIDISRKSIMKEDAAEAMQRYAQNKQAHTVMIMATKKLNIPISDLYEEYFIKSKPYGGIYPYFLQLKEDDKMYEFVKKKFAALKYKIRADIDVSCYKGVEDVVHALSAAKDEDENVEIALIKPPVYSISLVASNKQDGIRIITNACQNVKKRVAELGGRFSICTEPTVYGNKMNNDMVNAKMEALSVYQCEEPTEMDE